MRIDRRAARCVNTHTRVRKDRLLSVSIMAEYDEPSAADRPSRVADSVLEADLDRVLVDVPRGALALCGIAVLLMLLAWLAVYFGVFLPRGPVS